MLQGSAKSQGNSSLPAYDHLETRIVRRGTVCNRPILVYDNLLKDQVSRTLTAVLDRNAFTHTEIARPDTAQYRHWAANLTLADAQQLPLWQASLDATAPFCRDGNQFRIVRAYCNYSQFGDQLFPHTDCPPDAGMLTALWYIADEWHTDWGGETLFFDENGDAEFVVSPRPGRLVVFDGAILHVGRPPNRICTAPRYTFAFKFEPVAAA